MGTQENSVGGVAKVFDENDWKRLVRKIKNQHCIPFLGPEMSYGGSNGRGLIARKLLKDDEGFPWQDAGDLVRVAQFRATKDGTGTTKEDFVELLQELKKPDFDDPDEPHRLLAGMAFGIYATTNFDDYMTEALSRRPEPAKDPQREFCRWDKRIQGRTALCTPSRFGSSAPVDADRPTVARPLVFHLHGIAEIAPSLVLTEDDHLNFLVSFANELENYSNSRGEGSEIAPAPLAAGLTTSSVLFLGYRLDDFDFRVLMRSLAGALQKNVNFRSKPHIAVQLHEEEADQIFAPQLVGSNALTQHLRAGQIDNPILPPVKQSMDKDPAGPDNAERHRIRKLNEHLIVYCDRLDTRVFLGTCRQFIHELSRHYGRGG
jgi:hypothetical protein